MILMFVVVAVLVVSVVLVLALEKCRVPASGKKRGKLIEAVLDNSGTIQEVFATAAVFSAIVLVILILILIIGRWRMEYARFELLNTRERIEARIASGYCGYEDCVIDEVSRFNYARDEHLRTKESAWFGWYCSDKYEGVNPIDMDTAINSAHNGHAVRVEIRESD